LVLLWRRGNKAKGEGKLRRGRGSNRIIKEKRQVATGRERCIVSSLKLG